MPGFRGVDGLRGDGLTGKDTNQSGARNSGKDIFIGILKSQVKWNNPDQFMGGIDDFQIWNKALSKSEIETWLYSNDLSKAAQNIAGYQTKYEIEKSKALAGLYSFDKSDGLIAKDESGNENHAQLKGVKLGVNGKTVIQEPSKTAHLTINPAMMLLS